MNSVLGEVAKAVNGEITCGGPLIKIKNICLDSREVTEGSLFFAIKGERHDAHDFVVSALAGGAAAAVVSSEVALSPELGERGLIRVLDTRLALQQLARWHRSRFQIPVMAVTGSVGKTTTKDLLALCLGARFKTLKTRGNYNNEIGVPLTLLALDESYQAAVVEMAMRNRGEIRELAAITCPTHAIITNVEPVHLENLGSLRNIAEAKCEVLEFIPENGLAFINGDDALLVETARKYQVKQILFGTGPDCSYRLAGVEVSREGTRIEASIRGQKVVFQIPVPGAHLAYNVVAAAGAALESGVSLEEIQCSLERFQPSERRLTIKAGSGGVTVIDDCYNANPLSMQAALRVLGDIGQGAVRVAVLGDMYELGEYEEPGHREVGRMAAHLGIEHLITVGESAWYICEAAREEGMQEVYHFGDKQSALNYLQAILESGMVVLFKASRGMHLEEMVEKVVTGGDDDG